MRQRLGIKKHLLCNKYGKKKYLSCWVRGNTTHFVAWCWYTKYDADYVNYKTGEVCSSIRKGQFVPSKPIKLEKAPTWIIQYNKQLLKQRRSNV